MRAPVPVFSRSPAHAPPLSVLYQDYPTNWPEYTPRDKIADWLESYAKVMELNYWSNTEAKSARWDEATAEWTVTVERDGQQIQTRIKLKRLI